jgi:hypothetical protein
MLLATNPLVAAEKPFGGGIQMIIRVTILVASLLASAPAIAEPMGPEAAQRFVTGKLFAFNCVDGTRGLGQIYTDGSAMATIQVSGSGPARTLGFPPGTLKVKGEAVCATLKGLSFEPCFNLNRPASRAFADRCASIVLLGPFAVLVFAQ